MTLDQASEGSCPRIWTINSAQSKVELNLTNSLDDWLSRFDKSMEVSQVFEVESGRAKECGRYFRPDLLAHR